MVLKKFKLPGAPTMSNVFVEEDGGGGADWNASEGEDGYIKNRPFYESESLITPPGGSPLSFTISSDDLEQLPMSGMYQLPSDISEALSYILLTWNQSPWYDSGYARVSFLGYNYDLKYWSDNFVPVGDISGTFVDNPDNPVVGLGTVTSGADTMSFLAGDFGSVPSGTQITIELVTAEVHKIPEKYLPDDIGSITVIPLTFNQNGNLDCPDASVMMSVIQDVAAGKPVMFTTTDPNHYQTMPLIGLWPAYIYCDLDSQGHPTTPVLRFNAVVYMSDQYFNPTGYKYVIYGWEYGGQSNNVFYPMISNS